MFDLFDFTPVDGDPFKKNGEGTASLVVKEYQKGQPNMDAARMAAAAALPTNLPELATPVPEDWAAYAGNPAHPMPARIGSAMVEEARRYGLGLKNQLETFMGPVYGQGQVGSPEFVAASTGLASQMIAPGEGEVLGAGWNPKTLEYLKGALKKKPPLMPETGATVQSMITHGPEWTKQFVQDVGPSTPGYGYGTLASIKHNAEEAAKPKPKPPSLPPAPTAPAASIAPPPGLPAYTAKIWPSLSPESQAKIAAQAAASAAPAALKAKPAKALPSKPSTPMTPEQALFGTPSAVPQEVFNVPPLKVPTMKPYDPNLTGLAALGHETAPGTSGKMTPFNPEGLPMDMPSVTKRMQEQGFGQIGDNWLFWRGIGEHGPYSWHSAEMGYMHPRTKTNEPGLFLAPDVSMSGQKGSTIAGAYGNVVKNAHVVRSDNPLVMNWKDAAGSINYSSPAMQKAIKDAWAKGHDALLLKNIKDIGPHGNVVHDQLVVRNSNQLRHPGAVFNPKFKNSPNLLAARGTPGAMPLLARDQDVQEEQQ